jgi:predicted AAA+ superfamily ATPase
MIDKIEKIAKYNFWGNPIKTGYVRQNYLNQLLMFQNSRLIKVLVGQRRVGKSFILRQYIEHLIKSGIAAKNTIYINKEFTDFDFIAKQEDLKEFLSFYRKHSNIKGRLHVFIDEVQQIAEWERIVNSLSQDFTEDIDLIITGSNSQLLSGELATLLSGRFVQFKVLPFKFDEYCAFQKKDKSRKNYMHFLTQGALPELFHLPNEESKIHYVSSLKDTIILRDIVQRFSIKDAALLLDIFNYVVNNAGNLFSINNIVNFFASKKRKTNYETVANYLNYLTHTFVIHRCERFDIKGKDILGGIIKYYINDLSFRNYLFGTNTLSFGNMLENSIFLELMKADYHVNVGVMRDKEIDFIASQKKKSLFIQAAFNIDTKATFDREFNNLISLKNNHPKAIVTMDELPYDEKDGVSFVPAWTLDEYLKKEL